MNEYTHVFRESGNRFPRIGDEVIVEEAETEIKRVASVSPIHTRQWEANRIYLTLVDADRDYSAMSDLDADVAWGGLHHVFEIDEWFVEESGSAPVRGRKT